MILGYVTLRVSQALPHGARLTYRALNAERLHHAETAQT